MVDIMKRWLATGLGVAILTKERAEEFVQDLVREGQVSRDEGRELLDNLMQQAETQKGEIQKTASQQVRRLLEGGGIAHKDDLLSLQKRVDELEERLRRLEPDA